MGGEVVAAPRAADVARRDDTRRRVLSATVSCVERDGLAGVSLEEVARTAEVSRATVYRHFPGGRDELVRQAVTREVGRFWAELGAAVEDQPDLVSRLREALLVGHRAVADHVLLQQLLRTEPEAFLRELFEVGPVLEGALRTELIRLLGLVELRPGVEPGPVADYLTRLFLSYVGSHGRWDLSDRVQVDRLVRTQFLAGILDLERGDGTFSPA